MDIYCPSKYIYIAVQYNKHENFVSHTPRRFLNVFLLAMLNLAVMISLRNLPIIAEYGLESAIFYLVAALVFLFPSALISAELATGWSDTGGVYIWVKEA